MDYQRKVTHDIKGLTDHELSAIQAGLMLLEQGAKANGSSGFPEYKKTATTILRNLTPVQTVA